jgi:sugar/nucleoside kinase (ribokinase family)
MVTVHSDAERSFLHVGGANRVFAPEHLRHEACEAAEIFFVAGPQLMPHLEGLPLAHVLRQAKMRGQTTVLDTVMNPQSLWWDGVKDALPYLDWAIPSFEEAALLTGEQNEQAQVAKLKTHGAKNAAIKLGASGAYIAPMNAEPFYTPALEVEAVDSLGAGDAWAAGFVLGLLRGWPLPDTARFANAVGACCVQALGATTGIRSEAETWHLLGETR